MAVPCRRRRLRAGGGPVRHDHERAHDLSYGRIVAGAVICAALLWPAPVVAQPGTVEEIETLGLIRMSEPAFFQAFGVRPGDPYDPVKIRSSFRALWELNLFEDIRIDVEDAPQGGKALVVTVVERPVLSAVTYEDTKVITRTQIEDALTERGTELELGRPISMKRVFEAESTIRDILAEKGYGDAKVSHRLEDPTATSRSVHFIIEPGGKTKIKKIDFVGNEVFKDKRLKGELTLTKAYQWYWPWSKKSLYHPLKWDQDIGAVRELYQNAGYLDVEITPPVIDVIEGKKKKKKKEKEQAEPKISPKKMNKFLKAQENLQVAEKSYAAALEERPPEGLTEKQDEKWAQAHRARVTKAGKKVEKARKKLDKAQNALEPSPGKLWVALTVDIEEGRQYTTGEVSVEGNTVFEDPTLLALVPVREGLILSNGMAQLGVDRISRLYGDRGYLYANVVRQIRRHEDEPVADLRIEIVEDEPYYVDRIEFVGNTSTHDKVIRREFVLSEDDLFSRTKLDVSVRKVNMLGYVSSTEDPVIEPDETNNRVRITVPVEEQGRNQIQVGGGYSGVDGAFFTGMYSTRNFMGRGQIFSLSLQVGGRSSRYVLSFVEPWFLNRPYTLGFSLFRRDADYGNSLRSSGEGFGIVLGKNVGVYSTARLNYNYEKVTSTGFTVAESQAISRISSITPSYNVNKVNNPYRGSRGWTLQAQMQIAGGFLGGNTAFLKPIINYTGYRKAVRKSFFAFHASVGMVTEWADGTSAAVSTVDGIPRFERYWIGGDTFGPRIFETRTITPRRYVAFGPFGEIMNTAKDPIGLNVREYDLNGDGILSRADLVELGGDRFYLFQAECVYPLSQQLDMAFFLDVGNSLFEDTGWGFEGYRASAGIEMRFILPVFPAPLRLIYGVPIQASSLDRTANFAFAIGRSF
jgi:outer membrane protein insertion porin family